jgi:hypothetical protein
MPIHHNGNGDSGGPPSSKPSGAAGKVVRREVFQNGSQLIELENGSLLLMEGKIEQGFDVC